MLQLSSVRISNKRSRIYLLMKSREKPQEDQIILKSVLERFSRITAVFVLNFKQIFGKLL